MPTRDKPAKPDEYWLDNRGLLFRALLPLRATFINCVDSGWLFGMKPLQTHVTICGFPRSGSTLLQLMLETSIPNTRTFGVETHAPAVARYSYRNHPVLVTKRPKDIFWTEEILEFHKNRRSEARIIVTIRDPRDNLTSVHAGKPDGYFVRIELWENIYQHFRRIRDRDYVHVVRYEDIVDHPDEIQRRLSAFLNVKMTRDMKDFHQDVPTDFETVALNGVRPLDGDRKGRWSDPKHAGRIREVLRAIPKFPSYLIDMGYETDTKWTDAYC